MFEEFKYFQKKYSFEIVLISDQKFIIPEYKIDLLTKSKKLLNTIENINIVSIKQNSKNLIKEKSEKKKETIKVKAKSKKTKTKKKIRTLWVRRKKKS